MLAAVPWAPVKERLSILANEKGDLDVHDGAVVVVDKTGVRRCIQAGGVACLMYWGEGRELIDITRAGAWRGW